MPKEKILKKPKVQEKKAIKPQKKIEPNHLEKLNFEIPDDFLNEFSIEKIEVKEAQSSQYIHPFEKSNKISFKEMEIYINYLCKNIVVNDQVINKSDFAEEYIEFKTPNKEENWYDFLQKKRKMGKDQDEIGHKTKSSNDIGNVHRRRHPLKKKYKKINKKLTVKLKNLIKYNNSKNGDNISINLNQIQINKNGLKNFPLHPKLNTKEITKITFLKGLAERKDLFRINRKVSLFKDLKDENYFNNKKFKIIYKKSNEEDKYIVHISRINILNLILYYYYQIHKGIDQMNTFHYSHSAFYKSIYENNKVDRVINKCNLLTEVILLDN